MYNNLREHAIADIDDLIKKYEANDPNVLKYPEFNRVTKKNTSIFSFLNIETIKELVEKLYSINPKKNTLSMRKLVKYIHNHRLLEEVNLYVHKHRYTDSASDEQLVKWMHRWAVKDPNRVIKTIKRYHRHKSPVVQEALLEISVRYISEIKANYNHKKQKYIKLKLSDLESLLVEEMKKHDLVLRSQLRKVNRTLYDFIKHNHIKLLDKYLPSRTRNAGGKLKQNPKQWSGVELKQQLSRAKLKYGIQSISELQKKAPALYRRIIGLKPELLAELRMNSSSHATRLRQFFVKKTFSLDIIKRNKLAIKRNLRKKYSIDKADKIYQLITHIFNLDIVKLIGYEDDEFRDLIEALEINGQSDCLDTFPQLHKYLTELRHAGNHSYRFFPTEKLQESS